MIAGLRGIAWVQIDADQPVARLKTAILKTESFRRRHWSESEIDLHLAKRDGKIDGEWMPCQRAALAELQHAPLSDDAERKYLSSKLRLDPTRMVSDYLPSENLVRDDVIYVTVDIPRGYTVDPTTGKKTFFHREGMFWTSTHVLPTSKYLLAIPLNYQIKNSKSMFHWL